MPQQGMPGILEVELCRAGKFSKAGVVSRVRHKCKHALLTIQLTSSLFSIV